MKRDKGGVLVGVLWVVLILSVLALSLAASVRVEAAASQQSFDSEKAFFMAKGAAEIAYNSFAKQLPIPDDSPIKEIDGYYVFPFESGEARVRMDSEDGLIDINSASEEVLASLFDSVGLDRETRNRLVDSTLDWIDADDIPHLYGAEVGDYLNAPDTRIRPANDRFDNLDDLLLVKNMTPQIMSGVVVFNPVTRQYRRIPGIRELITTHRQSGQVNVNHASFDVLRALPGMTEPIAAKILVERARKRFESAQDLTSRVYELDRNKALEYLGYENGKAIQFVSIATVRPSGVSRTVRLMLKREEKLQILSYNPFIYKRVEEVKVDRWRFQ